MKREMQVGDYHFYLNEAESDIYIRQKIGDVWRPQITMEIGAAKAFGDFLKDIFEPERSLPAKRQGQGGE